MQSGIISRNNPQFKELKKTLSDKSDYIPIEGMKLFEHALKSNTKIEKIFIDEKNYPSILRNYPEAKNIETIFISNELLSELYSTDSKPTGNDLIITLARKNFIDTDELFKNTSLLILLEKVQDPGNLGTIIRSCLGFGIDGVILSEDSVNPFNSKVLRASAGALFNIQIASYKDAKSLTAKAKKNDFTILATATNGHEHINDFELSSKMIFMFGNEGVGLSDFLLKLSDRTIKIPHKTNLESLNLAMAATIVMWEIYKRK